MTDSTNSMEKGGGQSISCITFVELKALAKKFLPRHSSLRMLIEAEPDIMRRDVGLAKVEVFSRLLYKELESH